MKDINLTDMYYFSL